MQVLGRTSGEVRVGGRGRLLLCPARVLSVWGQEIYIFSIFIFHALFGMLLKVMGKRFLLSEDEPLILDIDGVMVL